MLETFSFIVVEKKGKHLLHYPLATKTSRYRFFALCERDSHRHQKGAHIFWETQYFYSFFGKRENVCGARKRLGHIRKHLKELIFALCINKTQIFASMGTSRNLALYKTKYSRLSILWILPTSIAHRPNLIRFILLFLDHVSVSFLAHHSSDIWENGLMGFLRQEFILLRQLGNRR